jgi:hypothetical protein
MNDPPRAKSYRDVWERRIIVNRVGRFRWYARVGGVANGWSAWTEGWAIQKARDYQKRERDHHASRRVVDP